MHRRAMRFISTAALAGALVLSACKHAAPSSEPDAGATEAASASAAVASAAGQNAAPIAQPSDKPLLGITAFVGTVYKEPRDTSKKLGYLRVGATIARSEQPAGKEGCPGGWYGIYPHGYVCVGKDATLNLDDPILKAASKRPNLKTALPYRYAFVRAVLPLYLRVPTADEQYKSEFKLKEHLDWYAENAAVANQVTLGANDVALDDRGVPLKDKKLGELGLGKNSLEVGLGALLGGDADDDAPPFWLQGGKRTVANISDFQVPEYAAFADRARRHTGLALVGSFASGPESLERRFAIMTDLRLAPASKIKPDTGSAWHGIELDDEMTLPLAFIRSRSAHAYKIVKGKVVAAGDVDYRSAFALVGKMRTVDGVKYYRTKDKRWLSQQDVGLAVAPAAWPEDAEKGQKWVEVSIGNQTLVLWEGKRPVYATLVSTGKAGIDDPKTTTATIRGTFKIRNKHITATMDSNETSSVGGRASSTAVAQAAPTNDDEDDHATKPAKPKSKSADRDAKGSKSIGKDGKPTKDAASAKKKEPSSSKDAKRAAKGDEEPAGENVPHKGDGEYGVTRRRGEGTFQLRDVPYIQYFAQGYALHAAYWHDVFGTPRSHGCVNLSPIDAHRVFFWTEPSVPDGWHAINTGEEMGEGTTVIVHE